MVEAAEQVGRGHGPESQFVDRRPRDQRRLGVDDGRFQRTQRKPKRAGDACRIEQRMKGQRVGGRVGLFDPELAEQRKFLARLVAGPNREPARGHAEGLGVRPRTIEVRALEDRHVFEALFGRLENAQAGKAEVAQNSRRLELAKVEIRRLVDHLLRHAILDDVDRDRRRVDEAPMQRLKRKAEFLVAPDRGALHAPDRRVLIEGEAGKHAWQRRFRLLERFRGQFDRHLHHGVGRERNRLTQRFGGGRRRAGRSQRSRERPADSQLQEFATLPVRHRILRLFAAEPNRTDGPTLRRSQPR